MHLKTLFFRKIVFTAFSREHFSVNFTEFFAVWKFFSCGEHHDPYLIINTGCHSNLNFLCTIKMVLSRKFNLSYLRDIEGFQKKYCNCILTMLEMLRVLLNSHHHELISSFDKRKEFNEVFVILCTVQGLIYGWY